MKAERLAEAERLRARGREAAQRIRARADREVVEIVAEARKESEILRGEGEAQRNGIFANAFQRDPGFFEFYRSMIAYGNALQGTGTTMVLSPDSEFFRFFRSPSGTDAGNACRRSAGCRGAPEPSTTATDASKGAACPTSWPPWASSSSSRAWSMAAFQAWRSGWRPKCWRCPRTCCELPDLRRSPPASASSGWCAGNGGFIPDE